MQTLAGQLWRVRTHAHAHVHTRTHTHTHTLIQGRVCYCTHTTQVPASALSWHWMTWPDVRLG